MGAGAAFALHGVFSFLASSVCFFAKHNHHSSDSLLAASLAFSRTLITITERLKLKSRKQKAESSITCSALPDVGAQDNE
jgi:hypothetical protein